MDIDLFGAGGGVGMYPGPLWWPGMGGAGGMYPGIGRGARVFRLLVELLKASQRIEWSTTVPCVPTKDLFLENTKSYLLSRSQQGCMNIFFIKIRFQRGSKLLCKVMKLFRGTFTGTVKIYLVGIVFSVWHCLRTPHSVPARNRADCG